MSVIFTDSADHWSTITDKYDGGINYPTYIYNTAGGRFGVGRMLEWIDGRGQIYKILSTNITTTIIGFAFKMRDALAASTGDIFQLADSTNKQCSLAISTSGQLQFYSGTRTGTQLGTSGGYTMPLNDTWHYFELKITINNTTGSVTLKVDGTTVMTLTNVNTRAGSANNYFNRLYLGDGNNINPWRGNLDDLVLCDDQGTYMNDFFGDVRLFALVPDGAGNSTQFTPSAGSNYQCVDESTPNGDTDYVSDATVGHKDLYTLSDLANTTGGIKAVVINLYARKDDAGTREICAVVRHSTSEADGPTIPMLTGYGTYQSIFHTNPSTTSPFTPAEVNAMEAGVKIIT